MLCVHAEIEDACRTERIVFYRYSNKNKEAARAEIILTFGDLDLDANANIYIFRHLADSLKNEQWV